MLKIKYLFVFLFFITVTTAFSQNNTSSPYSRYGIGDITNKSFGQSQAMGGTSIGLYSPNHLNIANPASYSAIEKNSFLFEFALTNKATTFSNSSNQSYSNNDLNLSYIAIGFPVLESWKASMGIIPYSNVGYDISSSETYEGLGLVEGKYKGQGGINQFYIGNSVTLFKKFSVGFNASYLFGEIDYQRSIVFPDDDIAYDNIKNNITNINDFCFNYGIQYSDVIMDTINNVEKLRYTFGARFDNSTPLSAKRSITSVNYISYNGAYAYDTVYNALKENGEIVMPLNLGFGFSIEKDKKYIFAADYTYQDWSNSTFFGVNDGFSNSNLYAVGFQYTPDYKSSSLKKFKRYIQRSQYRLGAHYSNTYLHLNDQQINDLGISFGVGLPLGHSKSTLNIAFEFGKRGTIENNLIKENYGVITLNLSMFDKGWFHKRKYD